MKIADARRTLGQRGEHTAAAHLEALGWRVLARNWRCRDGELDVVAFDPQTKDVVAVEVKTRSRGPLASPVEAVTAAKLARLRRLLVLWLSEAREAGAADRDAVLPSDLGLRVDVIAVQADGPVDGSCVVSDHIRGVQP